MLAAHNNKHNISNIMTEKNKEKKNMQDKINGDWFNLKYTTEMS